MNEKNADGSDPKCPVCGKTAKECQAIVLAGIDGAISRHDGSEAFVIEAQKLKKYWSSPKMGKLQADHVYPATEIKKDKNFQKLERQNLAKAREVMTAQTNMRGLLRELQPRKRGQDSRIRPARDHR